MKWKGRRSSTNVDDARGRRATGRVGAGLGGIIDVVLRLFGIKGILVLGVLGFVGWQMGLINPASLLGGSQIQEVDYQPSAAEEELFQFVSVVLADTEDAWEQEFARIGQQYVAP
ncbi:MAG: neutral zinc metallopeptidase, partial [Woeseiaceae bacterium]